MDRYNLEDDIRGIIWTKLCNIWDIENTSSDVWGIGKHYWYPLTKSKRDDLISLDSKYVITSQKLLDVKEILLHFGVEQLYEFRENGLAYRIDNLEEYDFWDSDDYFWNNEGFWFDDNMNFIIYLSHEETITLGGEVILKEIKSKWQEWGKNLKWDIKNK
jgi:hypothetical protein